MRSIITSIRGLLRRQHRQAGVGLLAIGVAVLGLMAGPFTAPAAAAGMGDCVNRMCLWMDPNFVNKLATWGAGSPGLCMPVTGEYNNNASSVYNNTNRTFVLYDNGNCTSTWARMFLSPGQYCSYLGSSIAPCNVLLKINTISSIKAL